MNFDKHDKARSILMETIASFVREEANSRPLITITNLTISPDYRKVFVFFTTIPESGEETALIFLKRKGTDLRDYLKKHARLMHIPHVEFQVDYGERHRQRIDEVAQRIEKEG